LAAPAFAILGAAGAAIRLASASVSRTDNPREMTSRDASRCCRGSVSASSARGVPIVSARRELGAHFIGQLQQPHVVCDRAAIFADRGRDLIVRQPNRREPLIRSRFVDRVQILALNVLDERELQQLRSSSIGTSRTTTGTFSRPRAAPRATAARRR
jgi:hypothetical protein